MRASTPFALLVAVSLTAACDDPAADAPMATTTVEESSSARAPSAPENDTERTRLTFDQSTSSVGFVGSKVTGSHEGGFRTFDGSVELQPGSLEDARVEVRIDTTTVFADEDRLTRHLKSDDFFDVARFPEARFVSTEIREGAEGEATHTVTGNLTLHGVTRRISFPATIERTRDGVAARAEFSINRKDFDINYPGMPNDLIRDLVLVKLDIDAREGES